MSLRGCHLLLHMHSKSRLRSPSEQKEQVEKAHQLLLCSCHSRWLPNRLKACVTLHQFKSTYALQGSHWGKCKVHVSAMQQLQAQTSH